MSETAGQKTDDPEFVVRHGELSSSERDFLENVKLGKRHDAKGASLSAKFVQNLLLFADQIPNAIVGVGVKNCTIDGSINISGTKINHLISITESVINGEFCCDYAELKALFLDGTTVKRLRGTRCKISASIYLRSRITGNNVNSDNVDIMRFHAIEGVNLSGASIEGALSARGAHIVAPAQVSDKPMYALNLADTRIGSIILGPKEKEETRKSTTDGYFVNSCIIDGGITFQRARCQTFNDSELIYKSIENNEKNILVIRGFQYENLGRYAPKTKEFRLKWLRLDSERENGTDDQVREDGFDPQTYEQLSKVLIRQGDTSAAKHILVEKERELLKQSRPRLWPEEQRHWARKALRPFIWLFLIIVYYFTKGAMASTGYGYKLQKLIFVVIGVIILGAYFYSYAHQKGDIVPSNALVARSEAWLTCHRSIIDEPIELYLNLPTASPALTACKNKPLEPNASESERALHFYPDFDAFWYAVDVFLPILTLRQEEFWVAPNQHSGWISARTFTHIFSLLGWLLSSLGIVGALGYLNRS